MLGAEMERYKRVVLTEEIKILLMAQLAKKIDGFRTYIYTNLINDHGMYEGIEQDKAWLDERFATLMTATNIGLFVGEMSVYAAAEFVASMDAAFGEFLESVGSRYVN